MDCLIVIFLALTFVERHFGVFNFAPVLGIYQMPEMRREKNFFVFAYWLLYLIDKYRGFFAADLGPNTVEGVELPCRAATLTLTGARGRQ